MPKANIADVTFNFPSLLPKSQGPRANGKRAGEVVTSPSDSAPVAGDELRYCVTVATVVVRQCAAVLDSHGASKASVRKAVNDFILTRCGGGSSSSSHSDTNGNRTTNELSKNSENGACAPMIMDVLRVPMVSLDANWTGVIVHSVNFPEAGKLWRCILAFVHILCSHVSAAVNLPAKETLHALRTVEKWMEQAASKFKSSDLLFLPLQERRQALESVLFDIQSDGAAENEGSTDSISTSPLFAADSWPIQPPDMLGYSILTPYFSKLNPSTTQGLSPLDGLQLASAEQNSGSNTVGENAALESFQTKSRQSQLGGSPVAGGPQTLGVAASPSQLANFNILKVFQLLHQRQQQAAAGANHSSPLAFLQQQSMAGLPTLGSNDPTSGNGKVNETTGHGASKRARASSSNGQKSAHQPHPRKAHSNVSGVGDAESKPKRRKREGPNYKPMDEVRAFGKAICACINMKQPGLCRELMPVYFKQGSEKFAMSNGSNRAVVERDLYTHLLNVLVNQWCGVAGGGDSSSAAAPSGEKAKTVMRELASLWWQPDRGAGVGSCFDSKHTGFGVELARTVMSCVGVPSDVMEAALASSVAGRQQRASKIVDEAPTKASGIGNFSTLVHAEDGAQ